MTKDRLEFLRDACSPDYTRGEFLFEAILALDAARDAVACAKMYIQCVEEKHEKSCQKVSWQLMRSALLEVNSD